MKRRMKKFALLVAAIMCLTSVPQNVLNDEAATAEPRAWVCVQCRNEVSVSIVRTGSIKEIIRTGDCTDRAHVSLGCFMCTVVYWADAYITCSKCDIKYVQNQVEDPVDNQHSALVRN